MTPSPIVFLVDVDNTLLNNDRIQNTLKLSRNSRARRNLRSPMIAQPIT